MMKNYKFLTKQEYFKEVTKEAKKLNKDDRFAMATMGFHINKLTSNLIDELINAKNRGAEVTVLIDNYIYLVDSYNPNKLMQATPGPLFWHKKIPKKPAKRWHANHQVVEKLRHNRINIALTNHPKRRFKNPMSGRSHIKFAIINDTCFIGGCNLTTLEENDIMLKFTNKKLAKILLNHAEKVTENPKVYEALNAKDQQHQIDNKTDILIDSGIKKQSIIFEKALNLIDNAEEEIFFTCQYFPNSPTLKKLVNAHKRGVKVILIYNNPSKHFFPKSLLLQFVKHYYRLKTPKIFFENELPKDYDFLHSKILLSEKEAMIGSHNFVYAGVMFGTAEICLHIKNASLNKELKRFICDKNG